MPLALRVGGKYIGPGTSAEVVLGEAEPLTVRVVAGQATGPKFFVVAGLHGDERSGVSIAEEVGASLDPRYMHGVVFVVARAAETALRKKQRNLPMGADLNRCFPGARDGDAAQRVAWLLFHEIVSKCDFGLDLHAAGGGRHSVSHARGNLDNLYVRRMCESFGSPVLLDCAGPPRSLRRASMEFGVPTFVYEVGGNGRVDKAAVQDGVKGVIGVMSALRMINGEIPWRGAPTMLREPRWLYARGGGRVELTVQPGASVRAGEVLARFEGGASVTSPRAGYVLATTTEKVLAAGAPVAELALFVDPPGPGSRMYDET